MQLTVNDCAKFDLYRDFAISRGSGVWHGISWRIERGVLYMGTGAWPLSRQVLRGKLRNGGSPRQRFFLVGKDNRRSRTILLTPDGLLGTRGELGLKYRSSILSTRRRKASTRAKIIGRLCGETPTIDWAASHPEYVPRKMRPRMRQTTISRLWRRLMRDFPEVSWLT
jgi:hypothetical protein